MTTDMNATAIVRLGGLLGAGALLVYGSQQVEGDTGGAGLMAAGLILIGAWTAVEVYRALHHINNKDKP